MSTSGVYGPLQDYFVSRPQSRATIILSFAEIEGIIGRRLPDSARNPHNHTRWWMNGTNRHKQAEARKGAGWKRTALDLAHERVTVVRADTQGED